MANLGYIQVTRRCNQLCRFCSNPPSGLENTLATACGHVDDFVARGYDGIILTGGEPTMVPWLPDLVRYARKREMHVRIITNGQLLGQGTLLEDLVAAGLRHVHVSLYSCRPELQDELSRHPGSHANILRTLEKIGARDDVTADINCVINHFNAGELDANVRFILERFPFVRHFVWNNLDPRMNRVSENPDTIPKLWEFELSLYRAMRLVDESGRSCRTSCRAIPARTPTSCAPWRRSAPGTTSPPTSTASSTTTTPASWTGTSASSSSASPGCGTSCGTTSTRA